MPTLPLDTNRFTATWATCARSVWTSCSRAACCAASSAAAVRQDVELGLGLGEFGGRLVGAVTCRADLAGGALGSVLVGARGAAADPAAPVATTSATTTAPTARRTPDEPQRTGAHLNAGCG